MFSNLTESLHPIIKNKSMYEQTLPISLNIPGFDKTLLNAPTNWKISYTVISNRKKFWFTRKTWISNIK